MPNVKEHTGEVSTDQYCDKSVSSRDVSALEVLRTASRRSKSGKVALWIVGTCVWIAAFAYAIPSSTSNNYSLWATSSFKDHSAGLSALLVTTSIIESVSKPFLAKMSDLWGRNAVYILGTIFYVSGYVIISQSHSFPSYLVGNVLAALGGSAVSFMNSVIVVDLTDLQWRGVFSALLSVPYLIAPWFTASIVAKLGASNNWRWGYGMYAMILPVATLPIIVALFWLSTEIKKKDTRAATDLSAAAEAGERKDDSNVPVVPVLQRIHNVLHEFDAFGLVLLAFGWTLVLLPLSLDGSANNNGGNPTVIAMAVVGVLCLVAFILYEVFLAPIPMFPRRILKNRTFMACAAMSFLDEFGGYFQLLYLSSYTYIASNWSIQGWTYSSNTLTFSLCTFGVIAGALQRITHRYKSIQIAGLCIKTVGYGIIVLPSRRATNSTALLISSSVLIGAGGSFSSIGNTVAAQAAVQYQDTTLAMALLSLSSMIGASVSSAIAAVLWAKWMPANLRTYLPASVNNTQVAEWYMDITLIRAYGYDDPVRQGAIEAYRHTLWGLFVPALVLSLVPLAVAWFQPDFFLGEQRNVEINTASIPDSDASRCKQPIGPDEQLSSSEETADGGE
ncbi:siderophore-iron transporter Str3 [Peniophora sp. CONT]|nr:siderophore-iron transporter Str3 [Peniophora sp. CONT]